MELNKKQEKQFLRHRGHFSPMPKKYEDLYNAGWDAFTMLGESKEDKDIANSGANLENIVVKVLHDNNINERNAGVFLSKYSGIPFNTFDGLVSFITEAYDYDIEPKNQEMVSIFELYKPQIEKVARRVAFKQEKYSASDFVALTQYKRIQENKIDNSQLLTEEDIRAKGLFLARDAKSFYNKENPSDIEKPVYDWASVQFYKYNNILEMPIKDYYTNEPILNEQERNFPKYDAFIESLKAKKYKLDVTTKIYAQADDVVIDRKNILISDESLSNTEIAVSAMYKLNKKALTKKRLFIFDDSYREAKKFFISRTVNEEGENFNPYKNLKKDKAKFIEYKNTLNEVISLLSTINQARIYMEGTTFKKVEDHLQLQASMQLARIPKIHSSWILPYISEKVLQVSKNNYQEAGLLDFDKLQELYAKTGRNVKNAQSIDELIFSKAEYSFDFKAQKEFNKEEEKVNISSAEQDIIRQRELYKRLMKEAAKQKELTDKEKTEAKAEAKTDQIPLTDKNGKNAEVAKEKLRKFLSDNLLGKIKLSQVPAMRYSKCYIEKCQESGVDMNKVANVLYKEMIADIDKNPKEYQCRDGNFHVRGYKLFKDYYYKSNCTLTPDTHFKKMLSAAVKTTEKDSSNER